MRLINDTKQLTALLDMSKAFDSIDHNLLLVKLQDVGASSLTLQWFRSYLTARYQVVTNWHSGIGTPASSQWGASGEYTRTTPL